MSILIGIAIASLGCAYSAHVAQLSKPTGELSKQRGPVELGLCPIVVTVASVVPFDLFAGCNLDSGGLDEGVTSL